MRRATQEIRGGPSEGAKPKLFFVGHAPTRSRPFAPPLSGGRTGQILSALCGVEDVACRFPSANIMRRWRGKHGKGDRFKPTGADIDRTWREIETAVAHNGCTHLVFVGRAGADAMLYVKDFPALRWSSVFWTSHYRSGPRTFKVKLLVVPHTTGINLFYNDRSNRRRVARLLRGVVREALR